jgi:hypothetical protein
LDGFLNAGQSISLPSSLHIPSAKLLPLTFSWPHPVKHRKESILHRKHRQFYPRVLVLTGLSFKSVLFVTPLFLDQKRIHLVGLFLEEPSLCWMVWWMVQVIDVSNAMSGRT